MVRFYAHNSDSPLARFESGQLSKWAANPSRLSLVTFTSPTFLSRNKGSSMINQEPDGVLKIMDLTMKTRNVRFKFSNPSVGCR